MLQVEWQQVLSQVFSFLLLLFVLRKFAWRPILTLLDERQARIKQDLDEAAKQKEEMVRLKEDYSTRIAKIEEEARAKIQQSVHDGKRIAMEIQEEARTQAHEVVAKSKETIELEIAKAKVTLRDEVVGMAIRSVERILGQKLDDKTDKRLVDAALDELEKETASK